MNIANETSPGNGPLLDADQFQAACDGNADVMRELVDLYFMQAGDIMCKLEKAIQSAAAPEVTHLAHKLAGSSLALGMSAVVAPVRSLEHGAREGRLDGAKELYAQAAVQLEALRQYMEGYISRLPCA